MLGTIYLIVIADEHLYCFIPGGQLGKERGHFLLLKNIELQCKTFTFWEDWILEAEVSWEIQYDYRLKKHVHKFGLASFFIGCV